MSDMGFGWIHDILRETDSEQPFGGNAGDLPAPPAPGEGRVRSVSMDSVNSAAAPRHTSACQACDEPVRWDREHVLAVVELEGRMAPARTRFCDRECWGEWARQR